MDLFWDLFIKLCIYILLVLSANLTIGMANLLSMCQAAFYGIGAYIATFFLLQFDLPFVIIATLVMGLTGLFSFLVSFASVRLKGDYFVIATMGFQLIVYSILYNWTDVTRGSYGILNIPGIKLYGNYEISINNNVFVYVAFIVILTVIITLLFYHLTKSPYGRVLNAIRSDEVVVESMGRNSVIFKSLAFFISAAVAGLAGLIYATYSHYIDPTIFTLNESILIVSALFIGGVGNTCGPITGAGCVIFLEVLRILAFPAFLSWFSFPETKAASLCQILCGITLLLFMYYRPQGIHGKKIIK